MEEKLSDSITFQKAQVWYPKVQTIRQLSKNVVEYIDSLKTRVNTDQRLSNGEASELYQELLKYKQDVMKVDSLIRSEFENSIVVTSRSFDSIKTAQSDFVNTFFSKVSVGVQILMLTKLQNNVKINENRIVNFCNSHFAIEPIFFEDWPVFFTNINSKNVKIDHEIRITTGIAAMKIYPETEIIINGKNIPIKETGVAEYAFKTGKIGKQFIIVRISFIDREGKRQEISKSIEYTVTK